MVYLSVWTAHLLTARVSKVKGRRPNLKLLSVATFGMPSARYWPWLGLEILTVEKGRHSPDEGRWVMCGKGFHICTFCKVLSVEIPALQVSDVQKNAENLLPYYISRFVHVNNFLNKFPSLGIPVDTEKNPLLEVCIWKQSGEMAPSPQPWFHQKKQSARCSHTQNGEVGTSGGIMTGTKTTCMLPVN